MSINEVRTMAHIINENAFLREENKVLDTLVLYSLFAISALEINLQNSRRQTEEIRKMYNDCMGIDVIRQEQIAAIHEQIHAIQQQHKREKRRNFLRAGGGGFIIGVLVMLIF